MPVSLLSARKPGAQRRVFLQPLVRNFPGLPAGLELRANLPLRAGERVRAAAELGLEARRGSTAVIEEHSAMNKVFKHPWAMKRNIERRIRLILLILVFGASLKVRADYFICQSGPDGGVPTVLKCACTGTLHCYGPEDRQDPETQLGAAEGAPTGDYECCHTGSSCQGLETNKVILEDAPGCEDLRFSCVIGQPCSNGPGICHGICKGNDVSITEQGDGRLIVSGQGSFCDAPMPGQYQEVCNGLDDDCNGKVDDVAGGTCGDNDVPDEEDQCKSLHGDPVHIGGGASYQRVPDVEVHGSINTYALTRSYISREDSWYLGSGTQGSFLPKPFGASTSTSRTSAANFWWTRAPTPS